MEEGNRLSVAQLGVKAPHPQTFNIPISQPLFSHIPQLAGQGCRCFLSSSPPNRLILSLFAYLTALYLYRHLTISQASSLCFTQIAINPPSCTERPRNPGWHPLPSHPHRHSSSHWYGWCCAQTPPSGNTYSLINKICIKRHTKTELGAITTWMWWICADILLPLTERYSVSCSRTLKRKALSVSAIKLWTWKPKTVRSQRTQIRGQSVSQHLPCFGVLVQDGELPQAPGILLSWGDTRGGSDLLEGRLTTLHCRWLTRVQLN